MQRRLLPSAYWLPFQEPTYRKPEPKPARRGFKRLPPICFQSTSKGTRLGASIHVTLVGEAGTHSTETTMNLILIFLIAAASTLLVAGPALAYLDPMSSSVILNSIAAAIFGCAFFIKLNWQRLKAFVMRKKGAATPSSTAEGEEAKE